MMIRAERVAVDCVDVASLVCYERPLGNCNSRPKIICGGGGGGMTSSCRMLVSEGREKYVSPPVLGGGLEAEGQLFDDGR